MLTTNNRIGKVGELKAMTEFTKLGYEVFSPINEGNSQIDFIAYKDGQLLRVNVKSTTVKRGCAFHVSVGSTQAAAKSATIRHKRFDPAECDILVVYIDPIDTLCFLPSYRIGTVRSLNISPVKSKHAGKNQTLIEDYLVLSDTIDITCAHNLTG